MKVPSPRPYTLRPATVDDFAFILSLRASGLREHVERIWGWDGCDQRDRVARRFEPRAYKVIVVAGRDVGAVSVAWRAGAALLADIEIAADDRGRGLGTAVLANILAEARRRNRDGRSFGCCKATQRETGTSGLASRPSSRPRRSCSTRRR